MTTRAKDDPVPGDSRFDAAWRAASPEEPPAALDAAIRAAARREVGAGPQRLDDRVAKAARRRWWPLAAAATVAAIAVGVIQHVTHEDLVAPVPDNTVVTDMPARGASGGSLSAPSVAEPATAKKEVAPAAQSAAPASEDRGAVETAAPTIPVRPQAAPATSATKAVPSRKAATPAQEAATRAPLPASSTNDGSPAERMDALQPTAPVAPPPPQETTERKADAATALPEPFPATRAKLAQVPAPAPAAPPAPTAPPATSPPPASSAPPAPPAPAAAARAEIAAPPPPAANAGAGAVAGFASAPRPMPMGKTATADAQRQPEARVKDRAPLSVPDWIALIRRLRTDGNTADAARELAAFRAAHGDHEKLLPPDLRDWHPVEK